MSVSAARAHWDRMYSKGQVGHWIQNKLVEFEIYRRMTGVTKFWLNWAFEDFLKIRPARMLSIGCGDGSHELIIARNRYVSHIDAFDASATGIEIARKKASSEAIPINFYVDTFEAFVSAPVRQTYDIVMFAGSLHHVSDLEGMLDKTRRVLDRNGVLLFNEYVGPAHLRYTDKQIAIVNRLLDALPAGFKCSATAQWVNPSIDTLLEQDPSEAVRSPLVLPLLESYFDVKWKRGFGGAILHLIFEHLNRDRLNDGSPESEAVVNLLIAIENEVTSAGVLNHDFCWGFCQHFNGGPL
jgi:2-polyprenyl-3-methyl-5-hydroxy-6-metoxy-1,4-benzoquinol methylase